MSKDIIIFVNAIRPRTFQALKDYETQSGRRFKPVVLVDATIKESIFACNGQYNLPETVEVVVADFNSPISLRQALAPYQDRIFAVTSQYENCIQELRRLLPYLPYVPTPTESSLIWATEKKQMRKMLESYDSSLVPQYMEVSDSEVATIKKVEQQLTYPVVVKPSGLEGSLLVTHVKNSQELRETLDRTFLAMQEAYDTWIKRQKPAVLIEEFMVGDMYTIDVYVDAQGICRHTPEAGVIVGRQVGYDDFFGYKIFLPSGLSQAESERGQEAAAKACRALGLRSVTAHVELMLTATGWKIIELGPRTGGHRHELYSHAYGINHIVNDIRNRANEEPHIPTELRNFVSAFNIYAHEEGTLKTVHGLETAKNLASFVYLKQNIYEGDPVLFAKNGGDVIIDIVLSHPDEEQLKADIATMEAAITFDVAPHSSLLVKSR
jgi:biotin carboxylase